MRYAENRNNLVHTCISLSQKGHCIDSRSPKRTTALHNLIVIILQWSHVWYQKVLCLILDFNLA